MSTYVTNMLIQIDNMNPTKATARLGTAEKLIKGKRQATFSLPAGKQFSCCQSTPVCEKTCYAKQHHHLRQNVQKAFAQNWVWMLEEEKKGNPKATAKQLVEMIYTFIFRIHESGDFHSQFAVDVWIEVAKNLPNVLFWFYTRNFSLNFTELVALPNVQGFASGDADNKRQARAFKKRYKDYGVRIAWGPWTKEDQRKMFIGTGKTFPEDTVICPVYTGKLEMAGACARCLLCVKKGITGKDIGFPRHIGGRQDKFSVEEV